MTLNKILCDPLKTCLWMIDKPFYIHPAEIINGALKSCKYSLFYESMFIHSFTET